MCTLHMYTLRCRVASLKQYASLSPLLKVLALLRLAGADREKSVACVQSNGDNEIYDVRSEKESLLPQQLINTNMNNINLNTILP